eukprot:tig00001234_g7734.t1
MVALGAVRRVGPDEPKPPLVSSLHTVDKKGADKFRLCLDAKRVNRYIHLRSFRYQTLDQVIELLRRYPNCWLVSYDLRKGYYHIALCMLTACILAFKWTIGGVTHYYVYQALPFGVAAACYIFTKVMRAFAKYWLVLAGVLLCTYIDDGLFICETLEEAILVSLHLQYLGVLLGLTFSDKTRFTPSQDREHLGLVLDTARGRCYLPEKKLRKLLAVLELLRGATAAPAVELQRIAGSLNAARHAFVGAALVSRPLTAAVAQADAAGARGQLAILGEMIGLKPMFPGSSTMNQLDKIMEITGRPSKEDVEAIKSPFAATMIESLPPSQPRHVSPGQPEALDLLKKLLVFNPDKRITALEALKHPYVAQFHNEDDEPVCTHAIRILIDDNVKYSIQDYREKLYNEVIRKKKEIRARHHSSSSQGQTRQGY